EGDDWTGGFVGPLTRSRRGLGAACVLSTRGKGRPMGKKPVIGLIGLVWAGIALTGCGECCRGNRRQTYNPTATFPTANSTDKTNTNPTAAMTGDARTTGGANTTPSKPAPEATGSTGFAKSSDVQPTGGAGTGETGLTPALSSSAAGGMSPVSGPGKLDAPLPTADRTVGTTSKLPPRMDERDQLMSSGSRATMSLTGDAPTPRMLPPTPVVRDPLPGADG